MKNLIKFLFVLALICVVTFVTTDSSSVMHAFVFAPLVFSGDNMGGFLSKIAFIPESFVSEVPILPALDSAVSADMMVSASGSFLFKIDPNTSNEKVPIAIRCTDKTVKYDGESQGETDGHSFKQTGEFFFAGSSVEAGAFARHVASNPGYLLIDDAAGNQLIVGQPGLLCHIKPAFAGGQNRTDRKGFKFTFEADSLAPFVYMESPVNIADLFVETV